jgi:hypothetical protein
VTTADVALAAFLCLLALLALATRGPGGSEAGTLLVHTREGGETRIPLRKDGLFPIRGPLGFSVAEVAGGRVRMARSPCPNQLCVRQGWRSRPGDPVVCLPNGIALEIAGTTRRGYDALSR